MSLRVSPFPIQPCQTPTGTSSVYRWGSVWVQIVVEGTSRDPRSLLEAAANRLRRLLLDPPRPSLKDPVAELVRSDEATRSILLASLACPSRVLVLAVDPRGTMLRLRLEEGGRTLLALPREGGRSFFERAPDDQLVLDSRRDSDVMPRRPHRKCVWEDVARYVGELLRMEMVQRHPNRLGLLVLIRGIRQSEATLRPHEALAILEAFGDVLSGDRHEIDLGSMVKILSLLGRFRVAAINHSFLLDPCKRIHLLFISLLDPSCSIRRHYMVTAMQHLEEILRGLTMERPQEIDVESLNAKLDSYYETVRAFRDGS